MILKQVKLITLLLLIVGLASLLVAAEHTVEKNFSVKKGGLLTVEADVGAIEIKTHSSSKVEAKIYFENRYGDKDDLMDELDKYHLNFDQNGKNVTIQFEKKDWDRFSWNNKNRLRVHIVIAVPNEYNVDLHTAGGSIQVEDLKGKVDSHTSGGSLKFGNIEGDVDGRTSGGSITLESCMGEVNVKTSGGGICIGRVKGNVDAHTSGGAIDVEEVFGNIIAKTSGGHIECTLTKQPTTNCYLKTSGGSIRVNLKEDIAVNLDAKTSGGRVRTDFPVVIQGELKSRHLNTEINGGGPDLIAHTSGGGIRINKL